MERQGYTINCCCATDWTMDTLSRIGAAQFNLAVTQAGVEIARHLERKFGTPWLAGAPVGEEGAKELAERMRRCASGEPVDALPEVCESADALVAGDWAQGAWKSPNTQCPAGSIASGCSLINTLVMFWPMNERKDSTP